MFEEPSSISKEFVKRKIDVLAIKLRFWRNKHYSPNQDEFVFYQLAKIFWPELLKEINSNYDFKCSGVMSVFIKTTETSN